MRTVGRRKQRPLTRSASAESLAEGARFNQELQSLAPGLLTGVPKGVHRFKSHADANRFDEACAASRVALLAGKRRKADGR